MADLSDVTAYLAAQVVNAVYPNGTSQPSVAAMDCRIYEGWPIPDQLDLDMAGKMLQGSAVVPRQGGPVANVSVFPLNGTGVNVYQIQDETYVVTPPSFGMGFTVAGNTITVTGQPNEGEYLTIESDRQFVYSKTGADAASILAALATAAQVDYPGAIATATTLTIPAQFSLVVRQGGIGVLGKATWRQRHDVAITVWTPTHATRTVLSKAIDNLIKQNIRVTLPDTSQAIVRYSRTNVSDEQQSQTVYRRDLIYAVEYATVETFPGYVITSVSITINNAASNASATAIT